MRDTQFVFLIPAYNCEKENIWSLGKLIQQLYNGGISSEEFGNETMPPIVAERLSEIFIQDVNKRPAAADLVKHINKERHSTPFDSHNLAGTPQSASPTSEPNLVKMKRKS